jgi:hypothetical protein
MFYLVKILDDDSITIMEPDTSIDPDDMKPNDWFWAIGTDEPFKKYELEIIAGPFSIEDIKKKLLGE